MMATVTKGSVEKIEEVLGGDARDLLEHKCQTVPKEQLHLPGADFVDRIWKDSDRPTRVLRSFESLLDHGRLAGTGYLSILPVDQGIEHAAGASFAPNPIYFDGAKIVELAIEGGYNAFKKDGTNYETAADLTGQANHLGVSIEADIIKQKLPDTNRGFEVIGFGKTAPGVYDKLSSDHPIDLCRYQVINNYMGRAGLINSGGESKGAADLKDAVRTAVINKRAGGMGLISGRKSFQRPMKEGIELLHAIQDVYLNPAVTIA